MSTDATAQTATSSPLKQLMTRHPLIAFFFIAFGGTWLLLLPIVLGKYGIGIFPYTLPDVAIIVFFILATFAGPTLSAFIMTARTSGKEGVRNLLRRYVQWRAGIHWYLIAIFGFLLLDVLSAGIASDAFFQQLLPVLPHGYDIWSLIIFFGAIALIIACTKGRISYKRERIAQPIEALPIEA